MARNIHGDFEGPVLPGSLGETTSVLCPICGIDDIEPGPMLRQVMDLGRAEVLECPSCHYSITVKKRGERNGVA